MKFRILLLASLFALQPNSWGLITAPHSDEAITQIIIAANAPRSVQLAARELQLHLKLVTGDDLPILLEEKMRSGKAILVGETEAARKAGLLERKWKNDQFHLKTVGGNLFIVGNDYHGKPMVSFPNPYRLNESYNDRVGTSAFGDTGSLFGAYRFLEDVVGVRWYMPGELGVVLPPANDRLKIPDLDLLKAPTFEARYAYFCFFDRSDDDALWYRRAGFGASYPVAVSHSFGHFFSRFRDTHPEFFALINGQRDFGSLSSVGPGNYNLSNPDLVDAAVEIAKAYFRDHPEQKIFPLVPNDGMEKISEDPESQAQLDLSREKEGGLFSNYVWGFVNKVAIRVAEEYPDRYIGCIAYGKYGLPPTSIEKLHPNVMVVVCKLRRMYFDPAQEKRSITLLSLWKEKVSTVYCWEYYCDILLNGGWRGYPIFYPTLVQRDLQRLVGVSKGEFIEAESWMPSQYTNEPEAIRMNYPGLQHPLLYVTARLLWDPNLDLNATLEEYYERFYGPAAPVMKAFWGKAEKAWMSQKEEIPADFLPQSELSELIDLLREGKRVAGDGSVYQKRVALIESEFSPAAERLARLKKLEEPRGEARAFSEDPLAMDSPAASPVWQDAEIYSLLDTHYVKSSPATHVRTGWNSDALFVSFTCFEPEMGQLVKKAKGRDPEGIWHDDSIELFVMNPEANDGGIQFIINSQGAVWDASRDGSHLVNPLWNGKATVKVEDGKARWTAVIKIPWSDLGMSAPKQGTLLRVNFCRNREVGKDSVRNSWIPMQGNLYYTPDAFGRLLLK